MVIHGKACRCRSFVDAYLAVDRSHMPIDGAAAELATVAERLPEDVVMAVRTHGQASDLWATVAALLAELEHTWTP